MPLLPRLSSLITDPRSEYSIDSAHPLATRQLGLAVETCSSIFRCRFPTTHRRLDVEPLLKDLNEKNQSFRRHVLSLAIELKEVYSRLASLEQSFAQESIVKQEAETKAENMEDEIERLQKRLEERLQAYSSTADKYLNELEDLQSKLDEATQATPDARAASVGPAQGEGRVLLKELDEKNKSLKTHEDRLIRLGQQLDNLQKDLQTRESSQKQLRNKVLKIERDVLQAVAKAEASRESEVDKIWDKETINKLLMIKNVEISKLKDEIRIISAHWKHTTEELESQLEKQRKADQELKKKVLKLEFCSQEARSQIRKLQRLGERRDKALKELKDRLAADQGGEVLDNGKQNFWESSGFKVVVSVSMLALVIISKR